MKPTAQGRLLALAKKRPTLHAADAAGLGLHTQALTRLVADGALERVGRGRYRSPSTRVSEHLGLGRVPVVGPRVPRYRHQNPSEVWVALDRRARASKVAWPLLRIVRFSGRAPTEGVENHRIEGELVRVYSLPKTLADCCKYRSKLGMDVALEALKDAWTRRRVRLAEIDAYARVCRVERVMRPYLEALSA
jgi:predicted transcriptional regulator of viral defense system